ncbi:MAG: PA14 domain-containing protein, partial [Pirellulaceae bacterium]|nr:PA14 domain-containing protein [Pirellulaceae bacterium]
MNPIAFYRMILMLPMFGLAVVSSAAEPPPPPKTPPLDNHAGKAIYMKLCTECHGKNGEAVKDKTDDPLRGKRSIPSLARRIEKSMPEDHEKKCVGKDAQAVAEYIYHAFYSVEARARNTPARVEVTRLTGRQFRNSIADVLLSFRGDIAFGKVRGLRATYYGGYLLNYRKNQKNDYFETRDDQIRFDFGAGIPKNEQAKSFDAKGFSIRWEGTLLPEETGVYEFVIRTRNGATLYLNRHADNYDSWNGKKTIDGWVAPNNEIRDVKGSVFLIGGRPYPIRFEFFKYKKKLAQVEFLWKPPHGVLQTIPKRNLTPDSVPDSLTVATPFPADDRSVGYERGTSVSKSWLSAVTSGAADAAAYVVTHLDELARTKL